MIIDYDKPYYKSRKPISNLSQASQCLEYGPNNSGMCF